MDEKWNEKWVPSAPILGRWWEVVSKELLGSQPVLFIGQLFLMLLFVCEQIRKTQAEPQWIVAQRLLSALTIPGFT